MSPTFCVRFFTGTLVLLLLVPLGFGQHGGASPPPSTGGTRGGGNPAPGGNNAGVGQVPFPASNDPIGQYPGRPTQPIFLSGRVMLEDGTPPPARLRLSESVAPTVGSRAIPIRGAISALNSETP